MESQNNYPLDAFKAQFMERWKDHPIEDIIQSQVLPSIAKVAQIRDNGSRDDYQLAAARIFLDKALPDKIEIRKQVNITHANLKDLIRAREIMGSKDCGKDVDNSIVDTENGVSD